MPVMSAVESGFCRSGAWRWCARRIVLPWALDGSRLSGEVLEIGAGSGAMAAGAAVSFPYAQITVTDLDPAMVDAARSILSGLSNVRVRTADATALPFDAATFDVATCYLMLHHVVDWVDAVAEASRVLRPGGAFLGYDLVDTRTARLIHTADRSPHRLVAPDQLRDGLTVAGFTDVRIRSAFGGHLMRFHARLPGAN